MYPGAVRIFRQGIPGPEHHQFRLEITLRSLLILRRHERDQDSLGPGAPRQRHRSRLRLGGDGMDRVEARLSARAWAPVVRDFGWTVYHPPAFSGGSLTTPMRETFFVATEYSLQIPKTDCSGPDPEVSE